MTNLTKPETAAFLREHDRYLLLTHRRPDGDTLGSAAALCRMLRMLGKTAHILENPETTPRYRELHRGLTVSHVPEDATLVCVDTASAGMLPQDFLPLADRIVLRIDHHAAATPFTPFALVEEHAAACGEILYDLLCLLALTLDKPTAQALYTAVSTDTGCFRYANTTAHTFTVAAACAAAGADIYGINQSLFETNSLARLRLQGWLVENAVFLADGAAAICPLPKRIETELGLTEDDLENISGFPRTIEGVRIAATLREDSPGKLKVSLRAMPGYDAGAICQKFGGGGHKGAAGASLTGSMAEWVNTLSEAILEALTV